MAHEFSLAPGVRTRVIRRRFSSLPQILKLSAAVDRGGEVPGTIERIGSRWVLGRTHTSHPLLAHNEVRKGYWDTFFEVYVTADTPTRLVLSPPRLTRAALIWSLAAVVVVAAAAVAVTTLAR